MNRRNVFLGVAIPSICSYIELGFMRVYIRAPWFNVVLGTILLLTVFMVDKTCKKMFSTGVYWFKLDEELSVLESAHKQYVKLGIVYLIIDVLFCAAMVYCTKLKVLFFPIVKIVLIVRFWKQLSP